MRKIEKYEWIYSKFIWLIVLIGIIFTGKTIFEGLNSYQGTIRAILAVSFFTVYILLNGIRIWLIKRGLLNKDKIYLIFRLIELLILYLGYIRVSTWIPLLVVFPILISTLCKGRRFGLILLVYSFILSNVFYTGRFILYNKFPNHVFFSDELMVSSFYFSVLLMFTLLCGAIYKDNQRSDDENKTLLGQLEMKYEQLAVAQDEIKIHYEKLKNANVKLEDTNKKLTNSIGEFYTL